MIPGLVSTNQLTTLTSFYMATGNVTAKVEDLLGVETDWTRVTLNLNCKFVYNIWLLPFTL